MNYNETLYFSVQFWIFYYAIFGIFHFSAILQSILIIFYHYNIRARAVTLRRRYDFGTHLVGVQRTAAGARAVRIITRHRCKLFRKTLR
jgi:hypothetical protein